MQFTADELKAFLRRGLEAQQAVDRVLSRARQHAERLEDGTYRVRCSQCGAAVSNPLPVAVVVRGVVECVDCLSKKNGPR